MPQVIGLAVLAGLISSALFLSLVSGVPGMVGFAYFVQLPLLLVGLSLGPAASALAAASACLTGGLIAGFMAAVVYGLVQALPALVVVRQALLSRQGEHGAEWFPPGVLLAQLTILATLGIGVTYVLMLDQPGGLPGMIEATLTLMLESLGGLEDGAAADLGGLAFLFPGLIAASWLVMVVLNTILAQALAVRMGWNRRPTPTFRDLQLPGWLWPVLGLAALLAWLGDGGFGFLGRAALVVLLVPYVLLGLAVLHSWVRRLSRPGLVLTAVYIAMVVLAWPVLAVLVLGLVEDWAQLRRRWA
jgi:hypothetical protein